MGAGNMRRLDDEAGNRLKGHSVEDDMAKKIRAFRALSEELRSQASGLPRTTSYVLIREDRDGGHRDG